MHATLAALVNRLDSDLIDQAKIIRWSSPVPSFGDVADSTVATLGLNPSNKEFVDDDGNELQGLSRRLHTLRSLGLNSWSEVDATHLRLMLESCRSYFRSNPYNRWFRRLDYIVSGADTSFYSLSRKACHLDLIPFATMEKWTELTAQQHTLLLEIAGDTLGLMIRDSPIRILILNGNSVVKKFEGLSGTQLNPRRMPAWSLPRPSNKNVVGIAYKGIVDTLSGVHLGRKLLVLGYNHNIQSTFGITSRVISSIREWVGRASIEAV